MALPSGASSIREDQAISTVGATPQEATHLQEALLCGLPKWKNDQEALEGQWRQQANN